MSRTSLSLVVWLLCALAASTSVRAVDAPAEPDVVLPDVQPPAPSPPPPFVPTAVIPLPAKVYYVITASVPCLVVASPDGLIRVEEESVGPGERLLLRREFVDSGGKVQTRRYTRPHVYVVTAVEGAAGRCELIVRSEGPKPGPVLRRTLEVGEAPRPPPVPPVPPIPPQPPPTPAPIPGDGLRVLIVYESADLSKYPPGQLAVLYSAAVRDYLRAKCAVGPDGKTREYRIYDQNVDLANESKIWQDAVDRATNVRDPLKGNAVIGRHPMPWVIVSNGREGYEGPLPTSVDEALALLKRFGG